ncbi:hypothetical protein JTB14_015882 [Gonioctena quinquepunctata]|nr:hypothetical protein JTB14_015882 [Gonioctena quinquepunctata]
MSVKAIHLELVSSLSTNHFLQGFKRFISRRGPVCALYSDRGTNFVGSKSVLADINNFVNSPEYISAFETELGVQGIEWHFNSPSGPEQGGLWESNVKSVKNHIYRVIGDQLLTYEEFSTLLTEIEALLNSRPLCQLSADSTAPEALTPAHFLTLAPLRGFPSEKVDNIPVNRLENRKSSTDSTDRAPGTDCSDIIDSFGPQLKRFHSDTSATMTAPEIDTESLSETLTASETELIQISFTEKETDRPTISQKKKWVE